MRVWDQELIESGPGKLPKCFWKSFCVGNLFRNPRPALYLLNFIFPLNLLATGLPGTVTTHSGAPSTRVINQFG